jgi:hypothetical protein
MAMRSANAIRVLGSVNSLISSKINGEAQSIVTQLSHTVIPVQRFHFPWSIRSEPIQIRCFRSGRHRDDPSIRLVTMSVCSFFPMDFKMLQCTVLGFLLIGLDVIQNLYLGID